MFKMPDITELRKFIDKTLGRKFRKGLFPECDSKEEIIKLLNEIKNAQLNVRLKILVLFQKV